MVEIIVKRLMHLSPEAFASFPFQDNDELTITPAEEAQALTKTWAGITFVPSAGGSAAVPPMYAFYEYKGFRIPVHLISLTGAGPETLEPIGRAQIGNLQRHIGLFPEMTFLEIGCGIGRAAFQLLDLISGDGRYIGVDVTHDAILWCHHNITARRPNFSFHHFDAFSECYNPFGKLQTHDFRLPIADATVDRIFLGSVFTHLLPDEVTHYLREFARVLKPGGLVYATFFLHSPETLAAAARTKRVGFSFPHQVSEGCFAQEPDNLRSAIAYTDQTLRQLIGDAGLELDQQYLRGWWSGLYDESDDGQDVAIIRSLA